MKKTQIDAITNGLAPVVREFVKQSVTEALERRDRRVEAEPPQQYLRPKPHTVDLRGCYPAKRRLPVVYLNDRPRRAGVVWL
jgi:hypothetical protein